jgi:hypothetical protein
MLAMTGGTLLLWRCRVNEEADGMGRRSRARDRAAAEAAEAPVAAPAPTRRQSWLRQLNPFRFRELNRRRARVGAAGFGLGAVLCMLIGRVADDAAWFGWAVLLAVLAVVWGITSAFLGEDERPG